MPAIDGRSALLPRGADPFVNRVRELQLLRAALEDALGGRGRMVLLAGEPGIGKTRLVAELAAHAEAAGVEVLRAWCWEGEGAPTFWPWVQLVRAYLAGRDQTAGEVLGDRAAELVPVIPEIAGAVAHPTLPGPLEVEAARFRFFDALSSVLAGAAARRPLLLIFDDVHWADTPSLRLLQFLARQMGGSRLMVIVAYRDTEVDARHALTGALAELAREPVTQRLRLTGLDESDIARVVELAAGERAPGGLAGALYRQTAGNPFFVGELLRLLQDEGSISAPAASSLAGRIPASVRAVIGRRLDRLSADTLAVLRMAAVIGQEFSVALLRRVASLAGPESVGPALEDAAAATLIVARPGRRYAFAHALIRETLHADLTPAHRARLHGWVGSELAAQSEGTGDEHVAELAYHFFEAARSDAESAVALRYAERAGRRALDGLAYEDAIVQFQHALELLASLPGPDQQRRCLLLLVLADAHMRAGDSVASRAACLRAAEVARQLGDTEAFARAALGFGWLFEVGVIDTERIAILEEALAKLSGDDTALRAKLMARLAMTLHWVTGAVDRRDRLSQEAVAMARRIDDPAALAFALNARQYALWSSLRSEERLQVSRELLATAERAGDRELALQSRHWMVGAMLELGDVAAMDREIAIHARDAAALRQPLYLWFAALWKTMRAHLAGNLDRVEELAEAALRIGLTVEPHNAEMCYMSQIFFLRADQSIFDQLATAHEGFEELDDVFSGQRRCGIAYICVETGQLDAARHHFEAAARDGFAASIFTGALPSLACAAHVCHALDDRERAAVLYRLLEPLQGRFIVTGLAVECAGAVDRLLGVLATALRQWQAAEGHFDAALAAHERVGAPVLVIRTLRNYADLLLRRAHPGDDAAARSMLERAQAMARAIGMPRLVIEIDSILAEMAAAAPGSLPVPDDAPQPPRHAAIGRFRREGEFWTIRYDGSLCRMKDNKGLQYLATLLRQPGTEVHAVDLVAMASGHAAPAAVAELPVGDLGDAGPRLDPQARAAYRQRLGELASELDEARAFNDLGRVDALEAERDAIQQELTAGVGLGGRDRMAASAAERARQNSTRAIRTAIEKIAEHHPALGRHFTLAVKTGVFCCYQPDPALGIAWEL